MASFYNQKKHWNYMWGQTDAPSYKQRARTVVFTMGLSWQYGRMAPRRVWIYMDRQDWRGRWLVVGSRSGYVSSKKSCRVSFPLNGKPTGTYRIRVLYAGSSKVDYTRSFTVLRSSHAYA